ncbi:dienelactone hydrolase family [Fusarium phyllophilum]|uniref:Dienelactone hydrolase family n=1 Tax=Fusarium phyllophilum TaxID=47803 RepID=A0A8H5NBN6_9HYPO|nr:dienelactone hydrolase family [Fusarium phyllophilum]
MSCSECFKGHSHNGQPTGEAREMFGRPTYVASPPDDKPVKGVFVIVPDAFGWVWYLAQTIYGMAPFFYYNGLAVSSPRIRSFFEALRLHEGPEQRIRAAGFCWGCKPVLTLAHPESITEDGILLVDAVFPGHPSGMSLPGDAEAIIKPVSVAIGDRDIVTSMSQVNVM